MNYLHLRNPTPNSPTDDSGGGGDTGTGGGDTGAGGGGTSTQPAGTGADQVSWLDSLPDDLKAAPSVLRHKNLPDALTALVAAEKRLGVPADQLLRLPTKPDDKEALGAIYKALGAPEAVDGYKVDLTNATDADKAVMTKFLEKMHGEGPYPPAFVQSALSFFTGEVKAQQEAQAAEVARMDAEGLAAIKTEWGAAFDSRSAEVGKLLTDLGGPELAKELDSTAFGSNPRLMILLGKITEKLAEGSLGGAETPDTGGGKLTPAQAQVARAALEGDAVTGKALLDKSHPQHAAVVAERNRLLALEHPQSTA